MKQLKRLVSGPRLCYYSVHLKSVLLVNCIIVVKSMGTAPPLRFSTVIRIALFARPRAVHEHGFGDTCNVTFSIISRSLGLNPVVEPSILSHCVTSSRIWLCPPCFPLLYSLPLPTHTHGSHRRTHAPWARLYLQFGYWSLIWGWCPVISGTHLWFYDYQ